MAKSAAEKPKGKWGGKRKGSGAKKGVQHADTMSSLQVLNENIDSIGLMREYMRACRSEHVRLRKMWEATRDAKKQEGLRTKAFKFLKEAAEIAAKIAPYETPKLSTTTLKGDPEVPMEHIVRVTYIDPKALPAV